MMEALFLTLIMSHRQIGGAAVLRVHQKISITLGEQANCACLAIADPRPKSRQNQDHTLAT